MKLVNEHEFREFTDAEGDKLYTIRKPKKRHSDKRDSMYVNMANIDIKDPNDPKIENLNIDQGEINKYMFQAVARKLVIGGQEIIGDKLAEIYLDMDTESGGWVDQCITEVWGETKEAKNG